MVTFGADSRNMILITGISGLQETGLWLGGEANNCVLRLGDFLFNSNQLYQRDDIYLLHDIHMVSMKTWCFHAPYRRDLLEHC